jgi:hypothetical protein
MIRGVARLHHHRDRPLSLCAVPRILGDHLRPSAFLALAAVGAPERAVQLSPWRRAADAADVAVDLMAHMPGDFAGFEITPESDQELREAVAHLEQANELLQRIADRENPRADAWAIEHAWALGEDGAAS